MLSGRAVECGLPIVQRRLVPFVILSSISSTINLIRQNEIQVPGISHITPHKSPISPQAAQVILVLHAAKSLLFDIILFQQILIHGEFPAGRVSLKLTRGQTRVKSCRIGMPQCSQSL